MTLRNLGVFHFVSEFGDPLKALSKALEIERLKRQGGDISNSLVVLPDAFNLGRDYGPGSAELPACFILDELRKLAQHHQIAFVAGILQGRCNTGYWVDATGRNMM